MLVCICGSMSVIGQMEQLAELLRSAGHDVELPTRDGVDGNWEQRSLDEQVEIKGRLMDEHFAKIRRSDVIVVANHTGAGVAGRVGANSLVEAAYAKAVGVPVLLFEPPGPQACRLEILALADGCLHSEPLGVVDFVGRHPSE